MVLFLEDPLKDIEIWMTNLKESGALADFKINNQKTKNVDQKYECTRSTQVDKQNRL